MAPDADCETGRLNTDYVPTHQGRRVLPEQAAPAQAWAENEESGERSPGENRRLLPAAPSEKHKSRLQAGLTLGVHANYPQKLPASKNYQKTRFQKRKEKLIEVLKPPYFILSMIIVIVSIMLMCLFKPFRTFQIYFGRGKLPDILKTNVVTLQNRTFK